MVRKSKNKRSMKVENLEQSGTQLGTLRATTSSASNRGFDALVDEMVGADTSVPQPIVPCDTSVTGTTHSRPTEAITASTVRPSQRSRATQPWGLPTRYNTPKPAELVPFSDPPLGTPTNETYPLYFYLI